MGFFDGLKTTYNQLVKARSMEIKNCAQCKNFDGCKRKDTNDHMTCENFDEKVT